MEESVLDYVGNEVTGVVAPVSICMALTVALVRLLNPEGSSQSGAVVIASIAYDEQSHQNDSAGQKLGGALLNSLIFACIMGGMTVVLFLLFKYKCYKVIYAYLGFAVFNIYFFMFGTVALLLLQKAEIHIDAFSFMFLLFNFSVVGMFATFFVTAPLLLRQMYLVVIGVKVAYIFTLIPEWTSWVLLVVMAVYDIIVVLCPGGPLKALVELAVDRGEELPALVYEARPQGRPYQRGAWHGRQQQEANGVAEPPPREPRFIVKLLTLPVTAVSNVFSALSSGSPAPPRAAATQRPSAAAAGPVGEGMETFHMEAAVGASGSGLPVSMSGAGRGSGVERVAGWLSGQDVESGRGSSSRQHSREQPHLMALTTEDLDASDAASVASDAPLMDGMSTGDVSPTVRRSARRRRGGSDGSSSPAPLRQGPLSAPVNGPPPPGAHVDVGLPDGIKLGMGDFIFYSMLVGRAAMFDLMTVFASYLAIIAGLGATLLLLAVARRALPALPISIAMGVTFYFVTRLVLEPFVLPMLMNYVTF